MKPESSAHLGQKIAEIRTSRGILLTYIAQRLTEHTVRAPRLSKQVNILPIIIENELEE